MLQLSHRDQTSRRFQEPRNTHSLLPLSSEVECRLARSYAIQRRMRQTRRERRDCLGRRPLQSAGLKVSSRHVPMNSPLVSLFLSFTAAIKCQPVSDQELDALHRKAPWRRCWWRFCNTLTGGRDARSAKTKHKWRRAKQPQCFAECFWEPCQPQTRRAARIYICIFIQDIYIYIYTRRGCRERGQGINEGRLRNENMGSQDPKQARSCWPSSSLASSCFPCPLLTCYERR